MFSLPRPIEWPPSFATPGLFTHPMSSLVKQAHAFHPLRLSFRPPLPPDFPHVCYPSCLNSPLFPYPHSNSSPVLLRKLALESPTCSGTLPPFGLLGSLPPPLSVPSTLKLHLALVAPNPSTHPARKGGTRLGQPVFAPSHGGETTQTRARSRLGYCEMFVSMRSGLDRGPVSKFAPSVVFRGWGAGVLKL